MGSPLPQGPSVSPEMKYCADCGKQMPRVADFCPHCGYRQVTPPRNEPSSIFGQLGRAVRTVVGPIGQHTGAADKDKQSSRATARLKKELKGIGGLLALFVVLVTIVAPFFILHDTVIYGVALWLPQEGANPGGWCVLVLIWAYVALHITTGVLLWVEKPAALEWVKVLFYARIGVSFLVWALKSLDEAVAAVNRRNGAEFLETLVFVGFWWVYFMASDRVKNTYGRNL